ncbi:T9SS type B sorting domain-containing protein [Muricauda sp. 2012CJ35-5]|uniref:T9SS type B sorting domain-containing protein n=1 Tax=Flagellimonas spongiicola TaxID=2942208 RepID=A0ABT0PY92_9FLAO|nr:T9SS type B sorting domain-containing protein [Allomuricauda spongiicola]MCL6275443.1 T9SS type B sorting domain-containing protein [Allomuricauda spongiicola]
MNLRIFCALVLCLSFAQIHAQLEASIWYFGENAGLDFRSGTPVPLLDGALNTQEGCATISDFAGNLMFYTDGSTVWNRNHTPMPNGTGLFGNSTSSQSGIIVPKPNDPDIFYVFTADFQAGAQGINYSEVDMTLDGGLGNVTVKNTPLVTPATEKLTAVEHANGRDIWVITHAWHSDAFLAYLITPAGVNTTPVTSNAGFDLSGGNVFSAIGYIKVSPDGTKLAACHKEIGAELFDFDPATGIVSNPTRLIDGGSPYGIEFSPSSQILYLSMEASSIFQYDLNAPDIRASQLLLNPTRFREFGMQLGIDGKIYIAEWAGTTLSVINNPNVVGVGCDYQNRAINLGGRISNIGLPPFIQSFFLVNFESRNFCLGDATQFDITVNEPIVSILWDFGDGNTATVEDPSHTYAAPGDYTVNVTVNTASDTRTETETITIYEVPVANTVTDLDLCIPTNAYALDVTSFDSQVLGTQSAATFEVDYFTSQLDADNNTNAVSTMHTIGLASHQLFARISNRNHSSCYATTDFMVNLSLQPQLNPVTDWTVCDDDADGFYAFDLTTKATEVLNGQNPATFSISYHASQADADTRTNPLGTTYTNTLPVETIYFRLENTTNTDCYETGSFTIEVIDQVVAHTPVDLEICDPDNDGSAIFDLTQVAAEVLGTQNPASLDLSYHTSQADADTGTNPLPTNYQSNNYQQIIVVRLANASNPLCYDTTTFQLHIFDTPVAPQVTDWWICDMDNDGVQTFDLSEKTNEIQSGLVGASVTYHSSQTDAELAQNPLGNSFSNTTNPQIVFFRLQSGNNPNCYDVGQFELRVFDTPTAAQPANIISCDVDETGSYSFDLSQQDATVLNGQDQNTYEVLYFDSEQNALNNTNPVSKTAYWNVSFQDEIYARVHNPQFPDCFATTSFSILINALPQMDLEDTYVICPDSPDLTIDAGFFESYEWRDSIGTVIGTNPSQSFSALGAYSLTVSTTQNGVSCTNAHQFEVVSSGAPDSFTVETQGISDHIRLAIDAIGIGTFEYSLDGQNYQSSNEFVVFPGRHTVYVRDPFGCRTLSQEVVAMGYERFFTPNGDGIHETWNVIGADEFPNSRLFIYDRMGKLLREIAPRGIGWDGTYLGNMMPSSDYWFRFEYGEGEVLTGHFSLKR